jgi:hypothetical protein
MGEITNLLTLIGFFGLGLVLGGGIFYLFVKTYIPSYLAEKAKNLATKEDVASITDKVESVKSGYAHILEEIRSNHQLKFAAIEREKSIKKEVYMDAIGAIVRSQNTIANFTNLNLSEEQITSNMANDSGTIAKIQVVGSSETVRSVTEYTSAIGSSILDLLLERGELVLRKSAIHTREDLRGKCQQEIDRYIAIMKNLNLEGNHDPAVWKAVNENIEFEQKQYDKFQEEISDLWTLQNKEHFEFGEKCMNRFFEISELLPNVVLSIRKELDMEIANDDYLNIISANIEKGRKIFEDFLRRVKKRAG